MSGQRVTRATATFEEGRPPTIKVELETTRNPETYYFTPAIAWSLADALGRLALLLDPKIADALRDAVADHRRQEIIGNGEL